MRGESDPDALPRAGGVKPSTLFAIAGVFWMLAGINVAVVGVRAFPAAAVSVPAGAGMAVGAVAVFAVFFLHVFRPYAGKHERRIDGMGPARTSPLNFMDRKGYIMVAFMIALGAGLRLSGFVPDWFIAPFYTGLGTALALTGFLFLAAWSKRR